LIFIPCLQGNVLYAIMHQIEKQVLEVIHNLNWLLEAHNSHVELIKIKGSRVLIRCVGHCMECETDCIGVAFKERMPDIILVRKK